MQNDPNQPLFQPSSSQPSAPKKKGLFIWLGAGILLLLACSVCGGAYALFSHASSAPTAPTNTQGTAPTQAMPSDTHLKVGKTAQVSSMNVTVNSAKTSEGGMYDQLNPGNIYLVVDVTVQNNTGSHQNVSSVIDFKLKDESGQEYNESFMSGAKPPDDTALVNGSKLRGQMVYQVPKSLKMFAFTYQPNFMASDQATWDISL